MAELTKFAIGSFVKWEVKNGTAVGEILEIIDDKAKVETPSGYPCEVAIASLQVSSETEYDDAIEDILGKINKSRSKKTNKQATAKEGDTMADDIKAQLEQANEQIAAMKKEMDTVKCALAEAEKAKADQSEALKASEAEKAALAAKVDEMTKCQSAKARIEELKGLDSLDLVSADEVDALAQLKDMDEKTYALVVKAAKASVGKIGKLTEQYKTSNPKLTDQTKSNEPKMTDQEPKPSSHASVAEEALANAKKEEDANLAAAGATELNKSKVLEDFVSNAMNKNKRTKAEKAK